MDPRLLRAAHAAGVVAFVLLLLLRVPAYGIDPEVAGRWSALGMDAPVRGAFAASFQAFAFVGLAGLAIGLDRAPRAVLTVLVAGGLSYFASVFLEAVGTAEGPLVATPGAGFRAATVGLGLVGAAAFLGLSEWARRGAGVAGPLLLCVAVLWSRFPADLAKLLQPVMLGELTLVGAGLDVALAVAPVALAGGLVGWQGVGERRLDDAPLGGADAALLVGALLGVAPALRFVGHRLLDVVGLEYRLGGLVWGGTHTLALLMAPLLAYYLAGGRPRPTHPVTTPR